MYSIFFDYYFNEFILVFKTSSVTNFVCVPKFNDVLFSIEPYFYFHVILVPKMIVMTFTVMYSTYHREFDVISVVYVFLCESFISIL